MRDRNTEDFESVILFVFMHGFFSSSTFHVIFYYDTSVKNEVEASARELRMVNGWKAATRSGTSTQKAERIQRNMKKKFCKLCKMKWIKL